ncbi:MAG: hypothetical protein IPP54_24285 [Anaerolineales bacterium]|nr:hypothetical protein [Anaerolineales bacterium]
MLLFNVNPFKNCRRCKSRFLSHPFVNAFVYGLLYGPIALPCSGPLVVSIFALSLTVVDALGKLNVFLWFGMGFGIPLWCCPFFQARRSADHTPVCHARAFDQLYKRFIIVGRGAL